MTAFSACASRSTGKERDTESGNDYFEARYYSSAMGRFMSPDWDTGGADQVNVHVFSKNGEFRGRLNPDTQKIEWTKGTPPKAIAEDAQAYCLSKGKFAIAAAKQEMSVLGGGKAIEEGAAGGSKLMEAGSWLLMALQVADIGVNAERMREINKMEGTTGFHLDLMGNMQVTNLQNFGDTFGAFQSTEMFSDSTAMGSGWTNPARNSIRTKAVYI